MSKRAAKTENPSDLDRFSRMQDELEALRNEITKKNRDQLDMMYNLDMDNFSEDTKALFKQWSDGANDVKTYFQTYIDSNEAKWTAYSEWKTSTSTSLASLEGRVTANESSITSLAQWKSEATNSIASISQKANANESSISSLTYWKNNTADGAIQSISAIRQTANSASARIDLLVNSSGTGMTSSAASIIMEAINDDTSSIKISADKIQLSGTAEFITAADLSESGSTIVSGNRIQVDLSAGEEASSSKLQFTRTEVVNGSKVSDTIGRLQAIMDPDKGSSTDSKYALSLESGIIYETGTTSTKKYNAALKLSAVGSISIESKASDDGGIFISSGVYYEDLERYTSGGYTTIGAYKNVRIRANKTHDDCGTTGSKDYVFCTDGIYYGTTKIVSI